MRSVAAFVPLAALITIAAGNVALAQSCDPAQKHCKPYPVKAYDLASGTYTGETIRGPRTVRADNLNTIRYSYKFGSAVTFANPPDLLKGLTGIPTMPAAAKVPEPPSAKPTKPVPVAGSASLVGSIGGASHTHHALRDPLAQVENAVSQSEAGLYKATQVTNAFAPALQPFLQPVKDTGVQVAQLAEQQAAANLAIGQVSEASTALTSYLKFSKDDTAQLVAETETALSADSVFTAGSSAAWPKTPELLALQKRLTETARLLNETSLSFTAFAVEEGGRLRDTEADLNRLQALLQSALTSSDVTHAALNSEQQAQVESAKETQMELTTALKSVKADEDYLAKVPGLLTAAVAQNTTAAAGVAALLPPSATYTQFAATQDGLRGWRDKMSTTLAAYAAWKSDTATPRTHADPFAIERAATCDFAFSRTKQTVLTLSRIDMMPGAASTSPETVLTVTVECTSPFSLSAGVAFSTIPDDEFTIVANPAAAAGSATPNMISENATSKFHPLPLALANMRLLEFNEKVALYGSFGVAANIRGQSAGGSTAEYLIGPSIGFFRTRW